MKITITEDKKFLIEVDDSELLWLRDDVEQCSFEYYISAAYQDFAEKFITAATEAEKKL